LSVFGWEIKPKSDFTQYGRWRMSEPCGDCPSWADNGDEPPRPPATVTILHSDKGDDEK
jgi:hypothetical protein